MPSADPPGPTPDTIAAIATPPGRGAIGIVRVSGPRAPEIARRLLGRVPPPRVATFLAARDARGELLDEGVVLYFPAPHSYTGEHAFEFQGHGGPMVLHSVLSACVDAGARLAEPGEFTRRAFLNGKLDLAQAESVADLIDAASREAARSALRSLRGEFSAAVDALVAQLVELRALTEAMLDFPDEEVDALHRDDAAVRLARVRGMLDEVHGKSRQGSLLRTGIHVVIAGRPNVGKSSLLNRLAGEERAIVTPVAGTTRDALREPIQIEGVPLVVIDTAGLRPSSDPVERLGIERTQQELARADMILAVFEAGQAHAPLDEVPAGTDLIEVYNKLDLAPGFVPPAGALAVSAKTGAGLDALKQAILKAAGWNATGESVFLARARHLQALQRAASHLDAATREPQRWELFAEELRLAQAALAEITGEFSADDLLGEIFGRFCIGK
ncbi:MAG: tRNA uridine-5-carboxymethylaminomethyl(34) synthesis GTPase MnmE [Betaproteobacteria bacterium]|nr:tRNA uridine-5-carboxymethylaminomethyl(34) synthesis GTPase MnmE [Betaproteobacteria bacterium]MDH4322942.1 tRNA uridine-5-carboxymethylaminomethyl(34) synthesis GTPase MnmE [Betaproteobacteria bacterium]